MTTPLRAALVACLLAVLPACSSNPHTNRSQLILFPADEVAAMGHSAAPELIAEFGGEVSSEELKDYVEGVGRAIVAQIDGGPVEVEWTFHVLDSDVVNAFALPGGHLFVTRELLARMSNEAQLAAVLGHEAGHVLARHVDERLSRGMIAQGIVITAGVMSEDELIAVGSSVLAQVTMLHYDRGQELESDRLGIRYMARAGYDPVGMIQLLEILMEDSHAGRPPEFLSTHPHPENRIEQARELIDRDYRDYDGKLYRGRFERRATPYVR